MVVVRVSGYINRRVSLYIRRFQDGLSFILSAVHGLGLLELDLVLSLNCFDSLQLGGTLAGGVFEPVLLGATKLGDLVQALSRDAFLISMCVDELVLVRIVMPFLDGVVSSVIVVILECRSS